MLLIIVKTESPNCIENENFCILCHPLTNLCLKCQNDILIPNENGGCDGKNKCILGKNYCNQCNEKEDLCSKCEPGFFSDGNGGCSYSSNCKISYKGRCLLCDSDFILIGEDIFSICKYVDSDEFTNCNIINKTKGICEECEKGFYLNAGDNKCTKTKNCYESNSGKCKECIEDYYLNQKKEECIEKKNTQFIHCKITLDGEKCDKCDENYFLTEDGNCLLTNFCKESENDKCIECSNGYHLIKNNYCSLDKNCEEIEIESGLCKLCKNNYYLDYKDRKCKSNLEENEFKYCKIFSKVCISCEKDYYLSDNSICSSTKYCKEANNGICISCENNYYLTLDNNTVLINGCIHSGNNEGCNECEDGYYYSFSKRLCIKSVGNFSNCRYSTWDECDSCKDNYYLLKPERKCYKNTEKNNFYKCKVSDKNGEFCQECEKGYYLTTGDNKLCIKMRGCKIAEDENICLKCDTGFCYDKKKKICMDNYNIEDEKNVKYFGCEFTDEEGKVCENCIEGYTFENGVCVNKKFCAEEKDGKCLKCIDKRTTSGKNICLNKILGCIEADVNNCYKCDDLSNLYSCTKCKEKYKIIAGYCL